MDTLFLILKKIIPERIFKTLQPSYHRTFAFLSAFIYGFPSRDLYVIGVTGTKGKSTTAEIINAILEEAGFRTALAGTIRFKIGDETRPNLFKMTMPGRFFIQKFLHDAKSAQCDYVILEMTSEGVKQSRHKYIELNQLVFTNITPEHIEAHGSFKNYLEAKLQLRDLLSQSSKENRAIVANKDDEHAHLFLEANVPYKLPYSLRDAEPHSENQRGILFTREGLSIHSPLIGTFNLYNILAAIHVARHIGIDLNTIKKAIEKFSHVPGRVEKIDEGQKFEVIVDYAHTSDSLLKLYGAFGEKNKICVLGNTGGGRDKWKRPEMGRIAEENCSHVILTNEDPYDEAPRSIVEDMAQGMKKEPEIIMDRREAIKRALALAKEKDVVLITGKGTDPYIMEEKGKKTPWSDASVAREELTKLLK
ncbi:MAG: UDP-N-acetylmuramoyl-L-alanyl-D-glutamate--2,6-diaminopimelate ligase [Candidatus Paceibacterota bacterium]